LAKEIQQSADWELKQNIKSGGVLARSNDSLSQQLYSKQPIYRKAMAWQVMEKIG
jgi:hypothetical protein